MKEKSIKLSDYFEIVKPKYVYIQIIPHKSIRNYSSKNIAIAIANCFKRINKVITREKKKIFFHTNFKISYIIDISNNNANFYFLVPEMFKDIILTKLYETWSKATIKVLEGGLEPLSNNTEFYEMTYKKDDALSLMTDHKDNQPLSSILGVMQIMKDMDRVMICYNFIGNPQFNWIDRYNETMNKLKEHKSIDKNIMSFDYLLRNSVILLLDTVNSVMKVIGDLVGAKEDNTKESLYSAVLGVLQEEKKLSNATKQKVNATVLNTQILIASDSEDSVRRLNNANSITNSFRCCDEDNELIAKKVKNKIDIEQTNFNTSINTLSENEVGQFLQIPGRILLTQHKLQCVKVEEAIVPEELQKGYLCLGDSTYKGNKTKAYTEDEYNKGSLPMVLIGSQGSGKTEGMKNIAKNCIDNNEGVIVLDFIKSCNLSESIAKVTPPDKLIKLNLAAEKDIQGLGYNEMRITEDMSAFKKLDLASMQTQQIMNLVDAISVGDPLSSRMRRYLSSASKVVFCQGYNSLKDVINCLEDHRKRSKYINQLTNDLRVFLEDEINTLEELNEWSRVSKKEAEAGEVSQIIGTNSAKIEHILDRVSMLREDFKLKFMYDKSSDKNINLVELMEQGKVVLLQMKEDDFPTKMIKNILITYWVSKVWLTSQIRGGMSDKPLRCNFIVDEIFQAPTSLNMMSYIIPQSRKFGLHMILSTQYINQLDAVFESLEASGSSFMLLKGCNENDFNHFKSKFDGVFEFEDLRDMENFSSMNLINYSGGYASFITKLPKPI